MLDPAAAEFLATLPYPRYYLDFETVQFAVPRWAGTRPYQQLVFQWSCHVEARPGELEHLEFLDTSGEPPMRAAAEALLAALGDDGPIFVYHDFEKWRLMEMAQHVPRPRPRRSRRSWGGSSICCASPATTTAHPALNGSYSLKTVLPTIDPELDHALLDDVQDGLSAQAAFHEADRRPTRRRTAARRSAASLLEYCALDTLALVTRRPPAGQWLRGAPWTTAPRSEIDGRSRHDARRHRAARAARCACCSSARRRRRPASRRATTSRGAWARGSGSGSTTSACCTPRRASSPTTSCSRNGFGMTDVCKVPRPFGEEPSEAEYIEGWERVNGIIMRTRPRILTFVYKGALDKVLEYSFGWDHKSGYGFNDDLMRTFGRRVFAFPLPGVACTLRESQRHLADLAGALNVV